MADEVIRTSSDFYQAWERANPGFKEFVTPAIEAVNEHDAALVVDEADISTLQASVASLLQRIATRKDDTAALKAIGASSRYDGMLVVVEAASDGVQRTYYFEADSSAAEDLPLVVEPTAGTGRWLVLESASLNWANPCATIAALKSITAATRRNMQVRLIVDNGEGAPDFYLFAASSETAESLPDVVAPTAGTGRWFALRYLLSSTFAATSHQHAPADIETDGASEGDVLTVDGEGTPVWAPASSAALFLAPVIAIFNNTEALPVDPTEGDRYIAGATANGWTKDHVYECATTDTWDDAEEVAPETGMFVLIRASAIPFYSYDTEKGWDIVAFDSYFYWIAPVVNFMGATPPESPSDGDRYIAASMTSGYMVNHVYAYNESDDEWIDVYSPSDGAVVWALDMGSLYAYYNGSWNGFGGGGGLPTYADVNALRAQTSHDDGYICAVLSAGDGKAHLYWFDADAMDLEDVWTMAEGVFVAIKPTDIASQSPGRWRLMEGWTHNHAASGISGFEDETRMYAMIDCGSPGSAMLGGGDLSEGDTITIGSVTMTMRASPTLTWDVALGASNTEALNNVASCINTHTPEFHCYAKRMSASSLLVTKQQAEVTNDTLAATIANGGGWDAAGLDNGVPHIWKTALVAIPVTANLMDVMKFNGETTRIVGFGQNAYLGKITSLSDYRVIEQFVGKADGTTAPSDATTAELALDTMNALNVLRVHVEGILAINGFADGDVC
jgi:hypothetical protein